METFHNGAVINYGREGLEGKLMGHETKNNNLNGL